MTRVLPTGWEEKSLGEIATIKGGKRVPKGHKLVTYDTGHPYIRVADFNSKGSVDLSDIHFIEDAVYRQISRYTISSRDLYISIAGTIGKSGIIPPELEGANLTENACKLILNPTVSQKFLYYFTLTSLFLSQTIEQTKVAGQPKLALARLASIKLIVPSLPEQKRIVEKLDKIFADIDKAKENTQKNLENAKEVFESTLRFLCTNTNKNWTSERADSYFVLQRGFDLPKHERKAGKYPLISSNGVTDYIDQYQVKAPVVTTGRSGTIGKVCYVDKDSWVLNTSLYIKDFKNNVPRFVYYFLQSMNLEQYASGAGVPTLNRNYVHEVVVNFPPKQEQSKIVAQLDTLHIKTQNLEKIYIKTLTVLEELKQSVLQQAFSGKL